MDAETITAIAGVFGTIFAWLRGRGQARRVAQLAEVLQLGRRAAKVVAGMIAAGGIDGAAALGHWERTLDQFLRDAGLEATAEQRKGAFEAALDELEQLGTIAMKIHGLRLAAAAAHLQRRLEELFPEPKKNGAKR